MINGPGNVRAGKTRPLAPDRRATSLTRRRLNDSATGAGLSTSPDPCGELDPVRPTTMPILRRDAPLGRCLGLARGDLCLSRRPVHPTCSRSRTVRRRFGTRSFSFGRDHELTQVSCGVELEGALPECVAGKTSDYAAERTLHTRLGNILDERRHRPVPTWRSAARHPTRGRAAPHSGDAQRQDDQRATPRRRADRGDFFNRDEGDAVGFFQKLRIDAISRPSPRQS